jgi:hypothetical protein
MAVFWFVALCRLIALMMEAAQTFETLVHLHHYRRGTTQKTAIFKPDTA